jgi:glycosyltransferase involved in cell wall biosynthesis
MNDIKVRFISNFPLSVVYGGFEHQCVQTCKALRLIGVDADLLDWHDADQDDYILHLFALDPMWSRITDHWAGRNPIVISAIAGTEGFNRRSFLKHKVFNKFASALHQETVVEQTRQVAHRTDKLICLNTLEKDFFVRTYELNDDKVDIVHNGVSELRFSATKTQFFEKYFQDDFVLFVGSISNRKNPLLLARCLNSIGVRGVFIGGRVKNEICYNNEFESYIHSSPNLTWIQGLGYDDEILNSAYAASKVFCLPSTAETQPLSALEAMATGKHVILGDFPYAYQPPFETAIKVDPQNEERLSEVIQKLMILKTGESEKLSEEYSWASVAKKIKDVYLGL